MQVNVSVFRHLTRYHLNCRQTWNSLFLGSFLLLSAGSFAETPSLPDKNGIQTLPVQRAMAELKPEAIFPVEGHPDWLAVTADAVWVSSSNVNHVVRLDAETNKPGTIITVEKPCSGLVADFGSLWIPSCGSHTLVRADLKTGEIQARIFAGPAESEGGITTGAGSVWIVTSKEGILSRVDPATNTVTATIPIPAGSYNPIFAGGSVWISSNESNVLIRVDATANKVLGTTAVGPKPRFVTVGADSVWTLNQGDGSISRVEISSGKLLATIPAGIPGMGGEIAFGDGAIWATLFKVPITRVDPATNRVVQQWAGPGGDSIRFGLGSLWLSNLREGNVWRLKVPPQ